MTSTPRDPNPAAPPYHLAHLIAMLDRQAEARKAKSEKKT